MAWPYHPLPRVSVWRPQASVPRTTLPGRLSGGLRPVPALSTVRPCTALSTVRPCAAMYLTAMCGHVPDGHVPDGHVRPCGPVYGHVAMYGHVVQCTAIWPCTAMYSRTPAPPTSRVVHGRGYLVGGARVRMARWIDVPIHLAPFLDDDRTLLPPGSLQMAIYGHLEDPPYTITPCSRTSW